MKITKKIFIFCLLLCLSFSMVGSTAALPQGAQNLPLSGTIGFAENAKAESNESTSAEKQNAVNSATPDAPQSTSADNNNDDLSQSASSDDKNTAPTGITAKNTADIDDMPASDSTEGLASDFENVSSQSDFFKKASFTNLDYSGNGSDMIKMNINTATEGTLTKKGDRLLYTFTITQRGFVELEFIHDSVIASLNSPWKISLYEKYNTAGTGGQTKYRELTYFAADLNVTSSFSNRVGVYPGTYVVAVASTTSFNSAEFFIKAKFTVDYNYEAECNDSIYRYNEIFSDKPVYGTSSRLSAGDDYDYYMFEMRENGYINLSFYHEDLKMPTVAWIITLYDEWGNVIHTGRSSLMDVEIASGALGIKKGIYFIEVVSNIYDAAEYNILLILTADNNFELEKNDTLETANTLKKGVTIRGSVSARTSPMERDFFKITLPSRGAFSLSFEHENLKKDNVGWNIFVYNSKGEIIYRTVSTWMDTKIQSPPLGYPAGDYYICIDANGNSHSSAIYSLTVDYQTSTSWEIESNDTYKTATKISAGNISYGALVNWEHDMFIYDIDYFYFELTKTSNVSLQFEHENFYENKQGWVISLIDSSEKEKLSFKSAWNSASSGSPTITLSAGKYYVKVDTGEWFNSAQYTLKLSIS